MRPEERDPAHLWDMLEAVRAIEEFTAGLTLESFLAPGRDHEIVRLAVERKLEILSEAARRISEGFRRAHPELPWREMIGLRNMISHEYHKVDFAEIYRIVQGHIPRLRSFLEPLVPPLPLLSE